MVALTRLAAVAGIVRRAEAAVIILDVLTRGAPFHVVTRIQANPSFRLTRFSAHHFLSRQLPHTINVSV